MQDIKIPQNVQVEDKLIGPLSLKQIILIASGGGISYTLFGSIQKSVGFVPPAAHAVIWLPAIFAVAFAMIKINDITLFRYVLLIIEKVSKPTQRTWQPRQGLVINFQTKPPKESKKDKKKKEEEATAAGQSEQVDDGNGIRLQELSVLLDQKGRTPQSSDQADSLDDELLDEDLLVAATVLDDGESHQIKKRVDDMQQPDQHVEVSGITVDPLETSIDGIHPVQS